MFTLFGEKHSRIPRDEMRARRLGQRQRIVQDCSRTHSMRTKISGKALLATAAMAIAMSGCAGGSTRNSVAPARLTPLQEGPSEDYVIGPLDKLTIHVWRNDELGAEVQVRPDGRITTPLVSDMPAVGKTPTMLAEDIRLQLSQYIEDPIVTVIVTEFAGAINQQVRIVGATAQPASLNYRANMTLLDAMIAVGGLSEYAAGNRARLIRIDRETGEQTEYDLRLNDLLRRGDSDANVVLQPGDVIIIPESFF